MYLPLLAWKATEPSGCQLKLKRAFDVLKNKLYGNYAPIFQSQVSKLVNEASNTIEVLKYEIIFMPKFIR